MPLAWLLNAKHLMFRKEEREDDILLIDMDIHDYGRVIDRYNGIVVLYPHGGAPILTWDGVHEPHPRVKVNLVTSEGHKEVMHRYGYPVPIKVIGWYLCEIKPWRPAEGKRVLFCPIHPIKGGVYMFEEDTQENMRVFKELLDMDIELSVRYRHALFMNGLHYEDGVRYYSTCWFSDLEEYDLVIANGTLAYAAIAKGIPTVMLKQDTCTRMPGDNQNNRIEVKSVDKYWDYLKYPFDTEDLEASMKAAGEIEPVEWRDRFIGEQMIGEEFCELIRSLS